MPSRTEPGRVRNARFQEYLRRLLNLERPGASRLNELLVPVVPIWSPTAAEHYRTRDERLWAATTTATGGVGTIPLVRIGLQSNAAPNTVVIVEEVVAESDTLVGIAQISFALQAVAAGPGVRGSDLDARSANPGLVLVSTTLEAATNPAAQVGTNFFTAGAAQSTPLSLPFAVVLEQGVSLVVQLGVTGANILRVNAAGRERVLDATETL